MKIIEIRYDVKQGLPNYSSRGASVLAVADEGDSLDVAATLEHLASLIREAWTKKKEEQKSSNIFME
jgi:hypothetical protein